MLHVNLNENSYDIIIEKDCLNKVDTYLNLNRKVLILTDSNIPSSYIETLKNKCLSPFVYTIKAGEDSKSLIEYENILKVMIENNFNRKDVLVSLGGGVVGDLGGFCAASYMRGIDFYNIPTTTLSMIDSSIGGKTAVNFHGYKNIIGAFYQPKKVLIDINLLNSLDVRQFNSGIVEAIKMAATFNEALFNFIENNNIKDNIEYIITESLKIKKDVVEKDEKETGLRKVLNYGHTIGHGIEVVSGKLYHGEAVALGTLCLCSEDIKNRLINIYNQLNIEPTIKLDKVKVLEAISHDKKANKDNITCIVVNKIGSYEMINYTLEELKERVNEVVL